jgi:hypothetical protein
MGLVLSMLLLTAGAMTIVFWESWAALPARRGTFVATRQVDVTERTGR